MTERSLYCLDIDQIRAYLPHRSPFLLIDRVLSIEPQGDLSEMSSAGKKGVRVVAQKAVSYNEPFFAGHFPARAIMPGVLILETMAQASAFVMYPYIQKSNAPVEQFECILIGVDSARFRKPVVPGDVLTIETVVTKTRGTFWNFECQVSVDGNKVAEAEILANLTINEGKKT